MICSASLPLCPYRASELCFAGFVWYQQYSGGLHGQGPVLVDGAYVGAKFVFLEGPIDRLGRAPRQQAYMIFTSRTGRFGLPVLPLSFPHPVLWLPQPRWWSSRLGRMRV